MKTKINGDTWNIEVVTTKQMKKERDDAEHLGGICVISKKLILISNDCVDYETIAHELYHAYFSTLYLADTNNILVEDFEEIAAEMFANKGEEIVRKARRTLKRLQKGQ